MLVWIKLERSLQNEKIRDLINLEMSVPWMSLHPLARLQLYLDQFDIGKTDIGVSLVG